MKQTLTLFFTFFGVFVLSAQNIGLNDTIVFYSEYESLMNMEKKSWTEGTNFDSIKTITALKIWNTDQLQFFLKNKNKFENIEAISINEKINDFDFLNEFSKLEHLSINISHLKKTSLNSLIKNLNGNQNIRLLDLGFSKKTSLTKNGLPDEFKNLNYIENLRIYNSRIRRFMIDFKVKHLIINYNISPIKSIKADQVEYIALNFNELRRIPEGLNRSKSLKGLSISDYSKFKVDCPLEGFENLIYFDAVSAKGLVIGRDCFENKKIKSIWGNVYEEYHLNEYKNGR